MKKFFKYFGYTMDLSDNDIRVKVLIPFLLSVVKTDIYMNGRRATLTSIFITDFVGITFVTSLGEDKRADESGV